MFATGFADSTSSYYNFYHYEFGEIVTICLLHYPKCSDKMALQRVCEILITVCECVRRYEKFTLCEWVTCNEKIAAYRGHRVALFMELALGPWPFTLFFKENKVRHRNSKHLTFLTNLYLLFIVYILNQDAEWRHCSYLSCFCPDTDLSSVNLCLHCGIWVWG